MDILWALDNLTLKALLDIFLVALVFYGASFLIRGTQATTLLRGMLLAELEASAGWRAQLGQASAPAATLDALRGLFFLHILFESILAE